MNELCNSYIRTLLCGAEDAMQLRAAILFGVTNNDSVCDAVVGLRAHLRKQYNVDFNFFSLEVWNPAVSKLKTITFWIQPLKSKTVSLRQKNVRSANTVSQHWDVWTSKM